MSIGPTGQLYRRASLGPVTVRFVLFLVFAEVLAGKHGRPRRLGLFGQVSNIVKRVF